MVIEECIKAGQAALAAPCMDALRGKRGEGDGSSSGNSCLILLEWACSDGLGRQQHLLPHHVVRLAAVVPFAVCHSLAFTPSPPPLHSLHDRCPRCHG